VAGTCEIVPGVLLDARRAVWLAPERALLVADLHLGFGWVQRRRGLLLPLTPDDAPARLAELCRDYRPARVLWLGDVLHARVELAAVHAELRALYDAVPADAELVWIAGNHDRGRAALPPRGAQPPALAEHAACGPHVCTHGDFGSWPAPAPRCGPGGLLFLGHEHPAWRLGDGVATAVKVPAFLVGDGFVVLPAFSNRAAGLVYGAGPPLGPVLAGRPVRQVIAAAGRRLLAFNVETCR
jgi:metallophosphoesterase superfamily enzyme